MNELERTMQLAEILADVADCVHDLARDVEWSDDDITLASAGYGDYVEAAALAVIGAVAVLSREK